MSLLLAKKRSHTLLSALFVLTAVCYVLCAASMFVPRLAMRDNVEDFLFKRKKDPDHPEK